MRFSEIPGQKEVIERLISSVNRERVSHAQLFAGPEGCGSLALALAYAQFVSCENRTGVIRAEPASRASNMKSLFTPTSISYSLSSGIKR